MLAVKAQSTSSNRLYLQASERNNTPDRTIAAPAPPATPSASRSLTSNARIHPQSRDSASSSDISTTSFEKYGDGLSGAISDVGHDSDGFIHEPDEREGRHEDSLVLDASESPDSDSRMEKSPQIENEGGAEAPRFDLNKKRKWLGGSFSKGSLPYYLTKRSKTGAYQQRAISWILQSGKEAFDRHFAKITLAWGLKPAHTGTCLLLPAK